MLKPLWSTSNNDIEPRRRKQVLSSLSTMAGAPHHCVRNQEHNRNRECTRMDPPTPSLRCDPAAAGRNKDQPQIFADGDRELKHHPISLVFVTVRQSSGRSLRDLLVKYLFLRFTFA